MSVRTISTKLAIEGEAEYKKSIQNINSALSTLKSELKLVESNFSGQANSYAALEAKGSVLADMYDEQAKKLSATKEALEKWQEVQRKCADEAENAKASVEKLEKELAALGEESDGTGDRQKELQAALDKAREALANSNDQYDKATQKCNFYQKSVNSTQIDLNKLSSELEKNAQYLAEAETSADGCATSIDQYGKAVKQAADSSEDCADSVEDYGKAAKDAGDDTDSLADKLKSGLVTGAKAAATAIAAVGTAAVAGVKFLNDIAESTEEYRAAQGKLNTAFEAAGYSTETAKEAYQTLFSILGDVDNATESAQLLAQLAKSEEDVATWGDIAAGVVGTFGDALPINSLIEASNETAKVGQVTGALADALNWVGISEDEFNAKLAACAGETERTNLITQTLSETYQNASDIFRENNATLMEANKAQAELDDTMARLGGTVAEVKTALTAEFAPALAEVADAFINLAEGTEGAEEELAAAIDRLIGKAAEKLPELMEFGSEIILNLLGGIANAAPQLAEGGVTLVTSLLEGLLEALPQLAEAGAQLIAGLVEGIAGAAPELIPAAAEAVTQLVQALVDNAPMLADAALDLVAGLADGILEAVPVLLEAVPELIESLADALLDAVPEIADTGVELLTALVDNLPEIIDTIVEVIPEIIGSVVSTILDHLPELIDAGIELLTALITDLPHIIAEIVMAMPEIITGMVNALLEGVSQFEGVGENLVRGLWSGIQSRAGWLWDKVSNWIQSIWDGITDFFGIASPSKQMAWVGEMLVEGLAGAVDANGKKAVKSVGKMTAGMMDEVKSESGKVSDALTESARAAIQGIVSGLDSQKEILVSSYKEVAKAAADGILEALPSDVLTDSLQESKSACEKLLATIKGERYAVSSSAAALKELLGVEEKSAAQKDLISKKVAELNEAVPTLGLAYNAVTDSINLTGEAIERLVETSGEQEEYEARMERLSELYTEQEQISMELEAAREALSQAEAEGAEGVQVLRESVAELTAAQQSNATQIAELETAMAGYNARQTEMAKKAAEMTRSFRESRTASEKLLTSIRGEQYVVATAAASLRSLLEVEEKSAVQKDVIAQKVAALNEALPTLGLTYDSVTDSINMTGEAIEGLVEKSGEQKEYEARVERLSELYAEQSQIFQELETAEEALSEAEAGNAENAQALRDTVAELNEALFDGSAQIIELEAATRAYAQQQAEAAVKAEEMTDRLGKMTEEVQKLHDSYESIRKKAYDSISGQLGLFGDLDEETGLSIDSMIASLQGQVEYMRVYSNNIRRAMEMGVDEGIIQKLSDGKEESSRILAAIVQGGQKEIQALNQEFARVELGKDAFAQTIAEMETDFRAKMGELVTDLNDAMNEMNMADAAYAIGVNNMLGLISGTESQRQALVDAYTDAAQAAMEAVRRETQQASPSKKFRQIGSYDIQGMIQGVESQRAALEAAYADMAQAALCSMERHLPSTIQEPRTVSREGAAEAPLSAVGGMEGGVVNHFHIGELNVRSDADLDYIAQKLYCMQQREGRSRGGGIL